MKAQYSGEHSHIWLFAVYHTTPYVGIGLQQVPLSNLYISYFLFYFGTHFSLILFIQFYSVSVKGADRKTQTGC